MKIEVRVEGVILHDNERLVLAKHIKSDQAYWVLPGGHLEFGESMEAGLKRELMEELAIEDATLTELIFADEFIDKERGRHVVKLGFALKIPEECFDNLTVAESHEAIKEVREFTREELVNSNDVFYPDKNFMINLIDSRQNG